MEPFLEKISAFMEDYHMADQGGIVVGLSGGPDSVCLLFVLKKMKEKKGFPLYAVHVHHGIRKDGADEDARFANDLCEKLSVPFSLYRYDVPGIAKEKGWSLEEAGRNCRYEALEKEREKRGASYIAIGHHKGDQAETVLFHLMRGSGLSGLSGMKPVRGTLIRPLLCVSKEEILSWLSQKGISWREDESNREDCFGRNRIRHELLPWMEEFRPRATEHIVAAAKEMGEVWEYLEKEGERFWKEEGRETPAGNRAPVKGLLSLPGPVRETVLRRMIPGSLKDITREHITKAAALLSKPTGKSLCLPGGRRFYKEYDWLVCEKTDFAQEAPSLENVHAIFSRFSKEKEKKNLEKRYTKWFDCDKIKATAFLRTRRTGDYIMLPGGKKKTVKAYMIDEKIPRRLRDEILLLADGSHILWIVGYRVSEEGKVTSGTRRILQVQIRGGKYHE